MFGYIYHSTPKWYNSVKGKRREKPMAYQVDDIEGILKDMTEDELAAMARDRDAAEKAGVFDDDRIYDCVDGETKKFTVEQEMALFSAVSDLSNLMKETNSSLSELLKIGGLING